MDPVFFEPYIFTSFTVPCKWYPLLFSISRIDMSVESIESLVTVRTLLVELFLVAFSTDLINECILGHMVDIITIGAKPCCWNPFPFSVNCFNPIELYCLVITFGTFLLHWNDSPADFFFRELAGPHKTWFLSLAYSLQRYLLCVFVLSAYR
jgi:hypothetical protein